MLSAKHFLLAAVFGMSFLTACHAHKLPATQSPPIQSSATQSSSTPLISTTLLSTELTTDEPLPLSSDLSLPETHIPETDFIETTLAPPDSSLENTAATSPVSTDEIATSAFPTEETAADSPPATGESATPEETTTVSSPTTETVIITSSPHTETAITTSSPTTEAPLIPSPPTTTENIPTTEPTTVPEPVLNRGRAEEAFQIQNLRLAEHDITLLQWSESLYQIAAQRVQEISSDYSHNGCPDWVAENILMGTNRPDLAIQIWYDSPGHQRNMLAGWTYGAIANYGFYWAAVYAMAESP